VAARIHRILAGVDGPGRRALPAGELLAPIPLAALVLLAVNDHLLKGSGALPGWMTGKLSDLAGLLFFPLLCTALLDLALLVAARLGAPVDFTLRRWKLAAACAGSAALFTAIKLSPAAAGALERLLAAAGIPSRIVSDPTDLLALPMVALAYYLGRREIARVPLGRLELVERRWQRGLRDVEAELADLEPPDRRADLARGLARYFETGEPDDAAAALRWFRESTAAPPSPP
jgi:hypothetical protein